MTLERLEIGPSPSEEDCAQIGPNYDRKQALAECTAYIHQLRRVFGPEPEGAHLATTSNSHDYGTYHEVAVKFDPENPKAVEYAFLVEGDSPTRWDNEALKELRDHGYPVDTR